MFGLRFNSRMLRGGIKMNLEEMPGLEAVEINYNLIVNKIKGKCKPKDFKKVKKE
jgi:hypothetical protein